MNRLFTRLGRIEDWFNGPLSPDGHPQLICIQGGMAHSVLRATIGQRRIEQFPGEPVDDFYDRALDLAVELGEPFVIVGGLVPR